MEVGGHSQALAALQRVKVSKQESVIPHMSEMRNACKILIGKSEGKRPLGRPRCRREDNIRVGLGENGREGVY